MENNREILGQDCHEHHQNITQLYHQDEPFGVSEKTEGASIKFEEYFSIYNNIELYIHK